MDATSIQLTKTEIFTPLPAPLQESETFRKNIQGLEKYLGTLPQAVFNNAFPLEHSFAEGIYIRTFVIPKGFFCMGKIHKDSYVSVCLSGVLDVFTEEGFTRIQAPKKIVSPGGIKRFAYAYEDCIWMTVHPNPDNCMDIKTLEDRHLLLSYPEIAPVEDPSIFAPLYQIALEHIQANTKLLELGVE